MNYPYNMWGPGWPPPPNYCPPTPTQGPSSWQEFAAFAKREAKREAKLKSKWEEEQKKKNPQGGLKPSNKPRPSIPLLEGLFLMVLLSPFIGLPTVYLYKMVFEMWGSAIGMK